MSAQALQLDFVPARRAGGVAGTLLVAAGLLLLGGVLWQVRALNAQRAGLELRYAVLEHASGVTAQAPAALQVQAAQKTVAELATPWSELLTELEGAGGDGDVALLAIEPDHEKHRVKVTAEARNLPLALNYIERLRSTRVLKFPMLESHEEKSGDHDHPVRFELSADWSDRS